MTHASKNAHYEFMNSSYWLVIKVGISIKPECTGIPVNCIMLGLFNGFTNEMSM